MKHYRDEYEGQVEFYSRVGINPDLSHNTDGVDRGNLYENKVDIKNIYEVLSQAIKYASRIRIRGEKLPANLVLNDLNRETAYIFKSADLLDDIEKVYFGAASKNNETYKTEAKYITIDYSTSTGLQELLTIVNSEDFVKYHVDKNNILGLSQQFYKHNQDKDKFIKGKNAEIRKPNILDDRIYPYTKADNIEFEDIMDCLNPGLLQREQGAYYTPTAYVNEMHKMLFRAIEEIPEGMDYIIIDRCAGTGNLEEGLPDEILKHCILSTIEFNEYAILNYKYGDKCLVVIPNIDALAYDIIPAEKNDQGIANDFIRERVNDPNCVVILMENPPFSKSGTGGTQKTGTKENKWIDSFIYGEIKKEHSGQTLSELSNLFIWSGFKYYLTKEVDSYILYSPTKYWRNYFIANKKFRDGFLCNRKEFHTSQQSAIACIWWQNINDQETQKLDLQPYDIEKDAAIPAISKKITIKKAYHMLSEAYDRRNDPKDTFDGLICEMNGEEFKGEKKLRMSNPRYNANIIGYLQTDSFTIDRKTINLVRGALYNGNGFYLRSDNYIEKLPLFVASAFPYDKWYKTDVYSKSYDGQGSYLKDKDFLKKCLFYTSLTPKNKCRSFKGSDKRFYGNELCFDREDTLAWKALQKFLDDGLKLSETEQTLLKYWRDVLFEASKTDEYKAANKKVRYGLWQIMKELNIKIDSGRKDKKGNPVMVYKYTALNTEIKKLDDALKNYYSNDIIPLLFKYELIK